MPPGGNASEDVERISVDCTVCQTILESHDFLYRTWCFQEPVFLLQSSVISKDLVDITTGHQTGKLLQTFALMIGFSFGNTLISQASAYASTMINLKVDREIQNDIFAKILVTDWESLTAYHTGDLVTRWSSDASNISSGILNWLPESCDLYCEIYQCIGDCGTL